MPDLNFASHFHYFSCFPPTFGSNWKNPNFFDILPLQVFVSLKKRYVWQNVTQKWIWKFSTNSTQISCSTFFRDLLSLCTRSCKNRVFWRSLSFSAFLQLEYGHIFLWEVTRKNILTFSKFNNAGITHNQIHKVWKKQEQKFFLEFW